jgi:hypothetical protein
MSDFVTQLKLAEKAREDIYFEKLNNELPAPGQLQTSTTDQPFCPFLAALPAGRVIVMAGAVLSARIPAFVPSPSS